MSRLAETTQTLARGLEEDAGDRPVQIQQTPGLLPAFLTDAPVRDYVAAQACDAQAYGAWCRALLVRGVSPPT